MEVGGREDQSLLFCCFLGFRDSVLQLVCVKLEGLLERKKKEDLASNNCTSVYLPHAGAARRVSPSKASPPGSV